MSRALQRKLQMAENLSHRIDAMELRRPLLGLRPRFGIYSRSHYDPLNIPKRGLERHPSAVEDARPFQLISVLVQKLGTSGPLRG